MEKKRIEWIEAAKVLAENPRAKINCPNCKTANLNVNDILFDSNDKTKGGERIIVCPNCQKFEAILMRNVNIEFGKTYENN